MDRVQKIGLLSAARALTKVQDTVKSRTLRKLGSTGSQNQDPASRQELAQNVKLALDNLKEKFDAFVSAVFRADLLGSAASVAVGYGVGSALDINEKTKNPNIKAFGSIIVGSYVGAKSAELLVASASNELAKACEDVVLLDDFSDQYAEVKAEGLGTTFNKFFTAVSLALIFGEGALKSVVSTKGLSKDSLESNVLEHLAVLEKTLSELTKERRDLIQASDDNETKDLIMKDINEDLLRVAAGTLSVEKTYTDLNPTQRYVIDSFVGLGKTSLGTIAGTTSLVTTLANGVHGYKRNNANSALKGIGMAIVWALTGPAGLGVALAQGYGEDDPN